MELNERIFIVLKEQKRTSKDLSDFIGVNPASVSAWKNEGSYPSSKHVVGISKFLGVSMEWLLTGEGSKFPKDESDDTHSIWELQDYQRRAAEEYYSNLTEEQASLLNNYEKLTLPNRREVQAIIHLKLDNQQEGRTESGTA